MVMTMTFQRRAALDGGRRRCEDRKEIKESFDREREFYLMMNDLFDRIALIWS